MLVSRDCIDVPHFVVSLRALGAVKTVMCSRPIIRYLYLFGRMLIAAWNKH